MTESVRLIHGDCLEVLKTLDVANIAAVVADPPWGMKWNTNSKRFSRNQSTFSYSQNAKPFRGRDDWGPIPGDDKPFDPEPWLKFKKVILSGANHYAARLPVGTTLVWIKRDDAAFGSFLSDAEILWMKGGHGVYCYRQKFNPKTRWKEGGYKTAHPTQKPVALMRWCIEKLKLKPGATILDPYMGSGSTGVAAVQNGFSFVGIEQDAGYMKIARKRINAAQADAHAA